MKLAGRALVAGGTLLPSFALANEGGGSMPQLDPTYYPSQIFWLVVTGLCLYFVLSRLALPRITALLEQRDAQVQSDLDSAYRLKQQAEDIKIAYSKRLREADDHAQTVINELVKDLKDHHAGILAQSKGELDLKIQQVEGQLRGEKTSLATQMPQLAQRVANQVVQHLQKEVA